MPRYFRKKPVVIEAMLWDGRNVDEAMEFIQPTRETPSTFILGTGTIDIHTREGILSASPGDWIIKGIQGELYPCKPDIFDATYEEVDDAEHLGATEG